MTFKIVGTRLYMDGKPVEHHTTRNTSGKLRKLKYGVLHYTASTSFKSDLHVLTRRLSVHFLLGQNEGEFVQIGELDDALWHAGKSEWRGDKGLNKYSLGIEVTCPGWLDIKTPDGWTRKDLQGRYGPWTDVIVDTHRNGGRKKAWVPFNDYQLSVLNELCPFLHKELGIEWIGHDDCAPTRKQDPGPCLDRDLIKSWNEGTVEKVRHIVTRLLKRGDKGPEVRALQTFLTSKGYEVGPIDGDFGGKTEKAVFKFQTDSKLRVS